MLYTKKWRCERGVEVNLHVFSARHCIYFYRTSLSLRIKCLHLGSRLREWKFGISVHLNVSLCPHIAWDWVLMKHVSSDPVKCKTCFKQDTWTVSHCYRTQRHRRWQLRIGFLISRYFKLGNQCLVQGWANFFVGGPNEKSKMSGGPT
jgi:hypothetical protein